MSVFKDFFSNKQQREAQEQRESEKRHMNFEREQNLVRSSIDDSTYFYQKERDQDLIKWQQNFNDELKKLKFQLKSYELTEDGWRRQYQEIELKDEYGNLKYDSEMNPMLVRIPVPPLANDIFINFVTNQVEPFLSRNMFNSNLSERRILDRLRRTMDAVVDEMADGFDKYGIRFENYDSVLEKIKNTIIPAPYRALNGWNKRLDSTIIKRVEAFSENAAIPEKKQKMFGIF